MTIKEYVNSSARRLVFLDSFLPLEDRLETKPGHVATFISRMAELCTRMPRFRSLELPRKKKELQVCLSGSFGVDKASNYQRFAST